jgi:hypothetical protein
MWLKAAVWAFGCALWLRYEAVIYGEILRQILFGYVLKLKIKVFNAHDES